MQLNRNKIKQICRLGGGKDFECKRKYFTIGALLKLNPVQRFDRRGDTGADPASSGFVGFRRTPSPSETEML